MAGEEEKKIFRSLEELGRAYSGGGGSPSEETSTTTEKPSEPKPEPEKVSQLPYEVIKKQAIKEVWAKKTPAEKEELLKLRDRIKREIKRARAQAKTLESKKGKIKPKGEVNEEAAEKLMQGIFPKYEERFIEDLNQGDLVYNEATKKFYKIIKVPLGENRDFIFQEKGSGKIYPPADIKYVREMIETKRLRLATKEEREKLAVVRIKKEAAAPPKILEKKTESKEDKKEGKNKQAEIETLKREEEKLKKEIEELDKIIGESKQQTENLPKE